MKRLRNSFKALLGYTLTEIVIVMLVVAVIVAVTIGVTKHKLDSIVTYTYYSAYSALRTATSQILADYDPTDERYQANIESPTLLAKAKIFFSSNFGVLAVNAADLMPGGIVDTGISDNTNPPIGNAAGPGSMCCRSGGYSVYNPTAYMTNYSCISADGPNGTHVPCMGSYCCYPKSNTNGGTGSGSSSGGTIATCYATEKSCPCGSKGSRVIYNGNVQVGCCCPKTGGGIYDDFPEQCPVGSTKGGCDIGTERAKVFYFQGSGVGNQGVAPFVCCCPVGMVWEGNTCVFKGKDCEGENPYKCGFCNEFTGKWQNKLCLVGQHLDESTCECVSDENPECTGGKVWNGTECVCPEGTVEQGGSCVTPTPDCTGGRIWNGTECVCPEGKTWDGSQCKNSGDGSGGGEGCTGTAPCGKQCNASTGTWEDIPGFSRECDEEQNKVWNETQCSCVPSSRSITLNGQKYCEYLVSLLNTKANAAECTGPSIGSNLTSFVGKLPDITLRNGMRMYNVRQNPQAIADLVNNTEGGKTVLNGVEVDTNKWGYTVYIDIDGEKGASEKWVDVYPFYVTLSGMVIPAYDKDHPGLYGGDSRNHLQVSIEDEVIDNGRRKIKWLAKSVSYKEAACGAGYIGANTPYCHDAGSIPIKSECSVDNSLCRLKYVKPIKFLF